MIDIAEAIMGVDGRVTVPKEVRALIGLDAGDGLMFSTDGASVIVKRKAARSLDPFAAFTEWSSPEDDEAFASL